MKPSYTKGIDPKENIAHISPEKLQNIPKIGSPEEKLVLNKTVSDLSIEKAIKKKSINFKI